MAEDSKRTSTRRRTDAAKSKTRAPKAKASAQQTPGSSTRPSSSSTADSDKTAKNPSTETTAQSGFDLSKSLADMLKIEQGSLIDRLKSLPGEVIDGAYQLVAKTTERPLRVGKAFLLNPDQARMIEEAGHSLKDLREVAGLTRDELSDALDLKDKTLLEAVEDGTATLSFELILRLAAVLARHDPVPFIMRYTRSYKPELWQMLENWGIGGMYLNFERERQFVNIYRRHDAARALSDEGFEKVLRFTRSSFDMAIHFVAEQENVEDRILSEDELREQEAEERAEKEAEPPSD